jgi:hypothetical protein
MTSFFIESTPRLSERSSQRDKYKRMKQEETRKASKKKNNAKISPVIGKL